MLLAFLLLLIEPQAAQTEVRNYSVSIQGAGNGTYQQKITTLANGLTVVESSSEVHFKVLIVKYDYSYRGRETWFNGAMQSCKSQTNDNGTQSAANATIENDITYSSVYWFSPKGLNISRPINVFDSSSGEVWQARATKIDGQIDHYRLEGKYPCELWFDVKGRLVKRTMTKQNRLVTVTLIR